MKSLTICQPYASLIMLHDADPLAKRIENRTWRTTYRGPLVIHAGASRQWLCTWYYAMPASMPFSAALGIVDLIDVVAVADVPTQYPHLVGVHCEGPWCWILKDPRPFPNPIPMKGSLNLWEFPTSVPSAPSVVRNENHAR